MRLRALLLACWSRGAAGLRQSPRKHAAVAAVVRAAAAGAHARRRRPPTRQPAGATSRGRAGPCVRVHRAAAQWPALRFLRRVALGGAGARSAWKASSSTSCAAPACSRRCSTIRRRTRRPTTCAANCAASRPTTPRRQRADRSGGARLHPGPASRSHAAREFHRARLGSGQRRPARRCDRGIRNRDRRGTGRARTAHGSGARRRAAGAAG